MKTNNHHKEFGTPLYKEKLDIVNTPQTKEEVLDILEIEAQNVESVGEIAISIFKYEKIGRAISIKNIMQSLFYAVQWPQLKRQMTKDAFDSMFKRHWQKTTAGAFVLILLFNIDFGNKGMAQISFPPQEIVSASVLDGPAPGVVVVSEPAKNNYIVRFSGVAKGEMNKFGIPASVILGMAIMYSNYGASDLAQGGHNHFDITCGENHLAEGVVGRNMHDRECYVHYQNAWTSYRANSLKLTTGDYKKLQKLAGRNYTIWLAKLQKLDYPKVEGLLSIIEQHQLDQFDAGE